ncbi:hypothetical protein ANN_18998 [Periplaneta americana]|uniref:Tc1-like transposase DDE domain-containing protein n=1 Tax=Periplaneta americana TaxID=6978 RepID=A0ABQ8SRL6_PERAM|nr:hypothetical protein ANN_18998 [Periplaneta americana]
MGVKRYNQRSQAAIEEKRLGRLHQVLLEHDNAHPHTANKIKAAIQELDWKLMVTCILSWPPRSPDLTPLDIFLGGHLKSVVYATPMNDAEELLQRDYDAILFLKIRLGPEMAAKYWLEAIVVAQTIARLPPDPELCSVVGSIPAWAVYFNARLIPFEELSLVTILSIMHVRYLSDYAMNYVALERKRPMQTSAKHVRSGSDEELRRAFRQEIDPLNSSSKEI